VVLLKSILGVKNRIYAMAMKDDTMDLLNFEQVIDDVKKG